MRTQSNKKDLAAQEGPQGVGTWDMNVNGHLYRRGTAYGLSTSEGNDRKTTATRDVVYL